MITAIIAGIGSATLVLLAWYTIRYIKDIKKRTKKTKAITDKFHTILTCHLHEHDPQIHVYIREDLFGDKPAAWMKAYGETYCVSAEPNTKAMIDKAKQAADFFEAKKPTPWKNNNPQNDAKKEHAMKIIVTGNPATDVIPSTYEADRWEATPEGYLHIFNKDNAVIGMHAPGTWAHVRGYVSIDAPSRQAHRLMEALQKRLSEVKDPAVSTPVEFRVAMGSGFVMVDGETFRL